MASGDATIVPGATTDASGLASATVTAGPAGPIVIVAARADAPTEQVTFNLVSTAVPYGLVAVALSAGFLVYYAIIRKDLNK